MREVKGDLWPDRDEVCHRVAYDFEGANLAIKHCKKLDLVIQAGGNVGVWPRYLRESFKTVWTFEPSSENYLLMMQNLRGQDIRAVRAALGKARGRCGIAVSRRNCGDDRTREGTEVEVVAIDDLNLDPDLIYLDVQGDERPILEGALKTIERCYPVIGLEIDKGIQKVDPRPFVEALGYKKVGQHQQDWIYAR